jgi:uncharacterized protein YjbJ (UPF0337 family)
MDAHDPIGRVCRPNQKWQNVLCGLSILASLRDWGNIMKSSTKDKIKGVTEEIEGTVKKGVGRLAGDRGLEEEGKKDQLKGAVRKKVGEVKKVFNQ